jgi:hypothetical protein
MRLAPDGIDVFYIDESGDRDVFVMTAVAIPFLRPDNGGWSLVWEEHFVKVRDWRRRTSRAHGIPVRKELHGNSLASGRGRYLLGQHQLQRSKAVPAYRSILGDLGFLQDAAIITVVGNRQTRLYGHINLEAALFALFQRMRRACEATDRQGLVFFDEGHGEYRTLYRKARKYLPTGSSAGLWNTGQASRNLPLDNFTKDANFKDSKHSFFIQIADLLAYAAFLKIKGEGASLAGWQAALRADDLYDAVPARILNTRASSKDPQGLVRLQ